MDSGFEEVMQRAYLLPDLEKGQKKSPGSITDKAKASVMRRGGEGLAGERLPGRVSTGNGLAGVAVGLELSGAVIPCLPSILEDQESATGEAGLCTPFCRPRRAWGLPVKQLYLSFGSPLLGWTWTHRTGPLPTAPCLGQMGQAALWFEEGQLWFLQPRDTWCVGVCP